MITIARSKARMLAAVAVGVLASTFIVAPAFANSVSCTVSGPISGSCETYYIPANGSGHYIKYNVCTPFQGGESFRIRDYYNGKVVKSGSVSYFGCTSGKVNGLYALYRLEIEGTPYGSGNISD
ncbi:hypothetical protein [Micromonospora sp. NPDC049175]|uniref:hypothetical protein n=1 Tax=unclassified Micromonospora TaxID=2617518 RepID=UPI0037118A36